MHYNHKISFQSDIRGKIDEKRKAGREGYVSGIVEGFGASAWRESGPHTPRLSLAMGTLQVEDNFRS